MDDDRDDGVDGGGDGDGCGCGTSSIAMSKMNTGGVGLLLPDGSSSAKNDRSDGGGGDGGKGIGLPLPCASLLRKGDDEEEDEDKPILPLGQLDDGDDGGNRAVKGEGASSLDTFLSRGKGDERARWPLGAPAVVRFTGVSKTYERKR